MNIDLFVERGFAGEPIGAGRAFIFQAVDLLNRISRFSEGVPQCGTIQGRGALDTLLICKLFNILGVFAAVAARRLLARDVSRFRTRFASVANCRDGEDLAWQ